MNTKKDEDEVLVNDYPKATARRRTVALTRGKGGVLFCRFYLGQGCFGVETAVFDNPLQGLVGLRRI